MITVITYCSNSYTVTHAADEAIMDALKKRHYTKDSILYTTAFPSCRDGVRIYRAGIKEVVYMKKLKSWRKIYNTAATEMLFKGEIITRCVQPTLALYYYSIIGVCFAENFAYRKLTVDFTFKMYARVLSYSRSTPSYRHCIYNNVFVRYFYVSVCVH